MHFLKTLFWVMVAVIAVIFSYHNWYSVTVGLWGGLAADVKLPILLLIAFLVGSLPWFLLHRTTRWSMRRKLEASQRSLEEMRARATAALEETDTAPNPPSEPSPHSTLI